MKLAEQGSTVLAYPAICKAIIQVGRENVYLVVFKENRFILDLMGVIPEGALRAMFSSPSELTLGEAYVHDDFDIEGDIEAVFDPACPGSRAPARRYGWCCASRW